MPASSHDKRQPSLRYHLANQIRRLREARGWSQEELAEQSGLHRTHVSLIERERLSVNLDNLAGIGTMTRDSAVTFRATPSDSRRA